MLGPISSQQKPIEHSTLKSQKEESIELPRDSVVLHGNINKEEPFLQKIKQPVTGASEAKPFKFASKYTVQEIMTDPVKAKAFEQDYLKGEGEYFSLARDKKTGLIFDGFNLDEKTGHIKDVRFWSAPSKESLDIGLCIKALEGDEKAALVVSKNNPSMAKQVAADILEKKMGSYMDFHKKNPGYGGFLPWIYIKDEVTPASDWVGAIPGLDNGEWVWSVLSAERALRKSGMTELADKYKEYSDLLTSKLGKIFYDKEAGKIRADVQVVNPESPDTEYKTSKNVPGKCDYLGDFHEGLMLILFVSLFAKDISEDDQKKIWENVHTKRVEHKDGTTWEAWCGSAHESWAYLFLPFRDIPEYKALFRIREEIRTQNAAERGYPGLGASTNEPGGTGYLSACGIEGIGTMEPVHNDKFAIYGVFPTLQECAGKTEGNQGLAWLLNMLKANKMQGPLGGGESATNDGKKACCVKTVDGTFPNLLAMTGGLEHETADMLKEYGIYDKFIHIMESKYKEAFGTEPLREPKGLAIPSVPVPTDCSGDYM